MQKQSGEKVHTQGRVAARRVWSVVERFLVVVFFVFFFSCLTYYLMAFVVMCLEIKQVFNFFTCWEKISSWYDSKSHDVGGYIPTIVGASASLLITLTTIIQSHYNREQDRVMSFPKNCVDTVSIGTDIEDNIMRTRKYFNAVSAETLMEFGFKESFSTYYKARPFRCFLCLLKTGRKEEEWEELPIYNFQSSNLLNQNPNDYEVLIEMGKSRLLENYCSISSENKDYRLRIVLDIHWTNNLLPQWRRMLGDIYMRETIELDGENDDGQDKILCKYSVLLTEHERAPLAAWILKGKCRQTKDEHPQTKREAKLWILKKKIKK